VWGAHVGRLRRTLKHARLTARTARTCAVPGANTMPPSMLILEIVNTSFKGRQFRFRDGLTIGASAEATIRAQHPEMLPLHGRFYTDTMRPMVEIANDQAHLFVNGRDVVRSELRHGDELRIGPLKLKVVDQARVTQAQMRLDQLIAEFETGQEQEVHDFAKEDLFYLVNKEPTLKQAVSFSIPSKDKFIDQAQVFLARLAKQCGMAEEKADAFMTCAKELILNAHRHGHKYDETRRVVLRWRDLGEKVQLVIIDEGEGFDHRTLLAAVRAKDAAQAARERYQAGGFGGLGFQLITRMSDGLVYNDRGNQVTMTVNKQG
jgi:anti-sigma regulatory factor (Ser/Thr protein kinase)